MAYSKVGPWNNGSFPYINATNLDTIEQGIVDAHEALEKFTQSGVGAVSRTVHEKLSDVVSVKDFGAVGDGVTDDSAAIQLALDAVAAAGGGALHIPKGRYRCANNGTQLVIGSNICLFGDGPRESVIFFDDSASTDRQDLLTCGTYITDVKDYNITLMDFGIEGDWGVGDEWTQRSTMVVINTTGEVVVTNCRFHKSRKMALNIVYPASCKVTNCSFEQIYRDGCRITAGVNALVANNYFKNIMDDSIAIHNQDIEASPVDGGIVVSGNLLIDSTGIACLGAKLATISGNTIIRGWVRGILVGTSAAATTEGNTATLGVNIIGNTIIDMFALYYVTGAGGGECYYIVVEGNAPTSNGSGYVSGTDGATIIDPYPYFYNNDTDAVGPNIGAWYVNVSNNICARTLYPTANWSDYGFGECFTRAGYADPEVTEFGIGSLSPMVQLSPYAENVMVSHNIISGARKYAIHLKGTASVAWRAWKNIVIANCIIQDWVNTGIWIEGKGTVTIDSCLFDGDPWHERTQRDSDGTWDSATYTTHRAIVPGDSRYIVRNCEFKNLGIVTQGPVDYIWQNNLIYCDPAVYAGYHVDNKGIGAIPSPDLETKVVVEDCDPTSATYGEIQYVQKTASQLLPTTGKYFRGHIVKKWVPTIAGTGGSQYVITGWIRLTDGTGHVLNTDWAEMRVLTGT